jgi:hypothetical protein
MEVAVKRRAFMQMLGLGAAALTVTGCFTKDQPAPIKPDLHKLAPMPKYKGFGTVRIIYTSHNGEKAIKNVHISDLLLEIGYTLKALARCAFDRAAMMGTAGINEHTMYNFLAHTYEYKIKINGIVTEDINTYIKSGDVIEISHMVWSSDKIRFMDISVVSMPMPGCEIINQDAVL